MSPSGHVPGEETAIQPGLARHADVVRGLVRSEDPGRCQLVDRTLVIGRAADCDVVIDHAAVSRHHATIDATGELIDLGSRNGTFVRGRPVARARVAAGDSFATPFKKIDAGTDHVCGIRLTGDLQCWGANDSGEATPPCSDPSRVHRISASACASASDRAPR